METDNSVESPILMVDDSDEDYEIACRAFRQAGMANKIYRCKDGDEALDYLNQRGGFGEPGTAPRPGIILLDLNMPGMDGREVLQELREVPDLRKIPVIVLTTSTDERDVESCYEMGANSYVQKPVTLEGYVDAIKKMKDYWFKIVILPAGE